LSEGKRKGVVFTGVHPQKRSTLSADLVREHIHQSAGTTLIIFEAQTSKVFLPLWIKSNLNLLAERICRTGAVLFRGFGIDSAGAFHEVVSCLGGEMLKYQERSSPRVEVARNIYTSTEYPPDQAIFPHNENSYAHVWPRKIFFCCLKPSSEGGATPIVDVRSVYKSIDPDILHRFERLGVLYLRNFSEELGMSWRSAFQTQRPEEVEEFARAASYQMEWRDGDRLRIRRTGKACGQHPSTGELIWFNHAAFFHISTLPAEIRETLVVQLRKDELPNNSFYGDGSPIEDAVIKHIRSCYLANQLTFDWHQGDILALDNMLVAHGRQHYLGPRRVLVAMTDPFQSEWLTI
jgi:alpha-ketoglutarate-dependent taurine dioxygenase